MDGVGGGDEESDGEGWRVIGCFESNDMCCSYRGGSPGCFLEAVLIWKPERGSGLLRHGDITQIKLRSGPLRSQLIFELKVCVASTKAGLLPFRSSKVDFTIR